jgi:hypothetical protein
MNPEALVAEAVKAAIGSLVKEAVPAAVQAGGTVWAWIKRTLAGKPDGRAAVAAVEADPAKASAAKKLDAALTEALEENPGLATELESVLAASGWRQIVTQTANVTGDNNKVAQVAGKGNVTNIS